MKPITEVPPLTSRRLNVIAIGLSWAVAVMLRAPGIGPQPSLAKSSAAVLALVVLGVLCVRNYRIGRFIADDADTALDERQIALRNRAYLGAYRVFGGTVALAATYITLAVDSRRLWYPQSRDAWQYIAEGVILLAVVAPSGWLNWFVPDTVDSESDSESDAASEAAR